MTTALRPTVDVHRAASRATTGIGWLDSQALLLVRPPLRPDQHPPRAAARQQRRLVRPGTGFETHPHRDMEIVTWVLDGSLVHQDSTGHNGVIYPGLAQRMSAGRGILHCEKNDAYRLERDARPRGRALRADVGPARRARHPPATSSSRSPTSCCAAGSSRSPPGMPRHDGAAAIRIANRSAALHAARLQPGRA